MTVTKNNPNKEGVPERTELLEKIKGLVDEKKFNDETRGKGKKGHLNEEEKIAKQNEIHRLEEKKAAVEILKRSKGKEKLFMSYITHPGSGFQKTDDNKIYFADDRDKLYKKEEIQGLIDEVLSGQGGGGSKEINRFYDEYKDKIIKNKGFWYTKTGKFRVEKFQECFQKDKFKKCFKKYPHPTILAKFGAGKPSSPTGNNSWDPIIEKLEAEYQSKKSKKSKIQSGGKGKYHKKKPHKYMKNKKTKKPKKKKSTSIKKTNTFSSVISMPKNLFNSVQRSMKRGVKRLTRGNPKKKTIKRRGRP